MPKQSTLAKSAGGAALPFARFTDHVHAMTTAAACDTARIGLERILSNLQRMQVPADLEENYNFIARQVAEGLQLIGNLAASFKLTAQHQAQEGSL